MKHWWMGLAILAAMAGPASAATFCVEAGDVAALDAALMNSQGNGEDDLIQVEAGTYDLVASLFHVAVEPHSLTIEGGYLNVAAPCGTAPTAPDASQTILDGGGQFRIALNPGGGGLAVKGLTITQMIAGVGVAFPSVVLKALDVDVSNTVFSQNGALSAAGIGLYGTGAIHIQNSLFASNGSFSGEPAVLVQNDNAGAILCNWFINNTVANSLSSDSALSLVSTNPNCPSVVANSVFWGNGSIDLHIKSETFEVNSDLTTIDVDMGPFHPDVESFSADPLFKDTSSGDYSVRDDSPLRDHGSTGSTFWVPGTWDVIGNPRTYNGAPDIGAFEVQDVIFAHGLDWQL